MATGLAVDREICVERLTSGKNTTGLIMISELCLLTEEDPCLKLQKRSTWCLRSRGAST